MKLRDELEAEVAEGGPWRSGAIAVLRCSRVLVSTEDDGGGEGCSLEEGQAGPELPVSPFLAASAFSGCHATATLWETLHQQQTTAPRPGPGVGL